MILLVVLFGFLVIFFGINMLREYRMDRTLKKDQEDFDNRNR